MNKMYLVLGDWSDDGHGKYDNILLQSNLSVKEIMYMTGFNTASYFSKCFKKQFGVIPSKYVRQIDKSNDKIEFE